jgi:hypothetical protein
MSRREIEEIEAYAMHSFRDSEVYPLMPLLRKGVLHTTNIDGYRGIRRSGKILPNTGDLPYSYSQSEHYYGSSKGWVCLFDFESAREEDYRRNHILWSDFFLSRNPRRGPATIVLNVNRQKLADKLIPNSARPRLGEPEYKPAFAYVEAWYPDAIPSSAIDSYIITWQNPAKHKLEFQEFSKADVEKLEEKISWIQHEELNSSIKKLVHNLLREKAE